MLKTFAAALALLSLCSQVYAQGSLSGTVTDNAGNPVAGARVAFMNHGNSGLHGHHPGPNYESQSNSNGSFALASVFAGSYMATASKMTYGHDAGSITVQDGQNTVINFALSMGRHGNGGMHDDTLKIAHILGKAMINYEQGRTNYFFDTNGDLQADFRLLFGPDWYVPGGGTERPADGDSIWLNCGLLGYSLPQSVVVYDISDQFWRQPGGSHGGHGGEGGGCPDPTDLILTEIVGRTLVEQPGGNPSYFLDENGDQVADYSLNFGASWFNPGMVRPGEGDTIDIIGGLMDNCAQGQVIIVYEVSDQFWREPGDTSALWIQNTAIADDGDLLPKSHIVSTLYPNPFNPSAILSFELPQAEKANISIYDVLGRRVVLLADRFFPSGKNSVKIDAAILKIDNSAIYFYRIQAGPYQSTGKMTLLK